MSQDPRPRGAAKAVVLAVGVLFLAAAGYWAWTGLSRPEQAVPAVRVQVRVVDAAGAALAGAEVRSRYGGEWATCDARGAALLVDPRVKTGAATAEAALADALEARAVFHAARRGDAPVVTRTAAGDLTAEIRLTPCGILRLGVAPTGLAGARARVDPDPTGRLWRLAEGHDVIRAGEAATYVVFEGAGTIWVTLEGDRGVAQSRLKFDAPGPGLRLEKSLSPGPAAPIRGRVRLPDGAWVPSLAGRLDVTEIDALGRDTIERLPVRIAPDGSFAVDYVGEGRFTLTAHVPFAAVDLPVGAAGGDESVEIAAAPRPWIELGPLDLARLDPPARVSLFGMDAETDLVVEGGALAVPQGVAVAAPRAGAYRVVVAQRGTDASPPRSGRGTLTLGSEGPHPLLVEMTDLPYGTLRVSVDPVPERGGVVRVLPDREHTLLGKVSRHVHFPHLPEGEAQVSILWQDPTLAQEVLRAKIVDGSIAVLVIVPAAGAPLRVDTAGTVAEHDPRSWTLRLTPGGSPYGDVDARLPLDREGASTVLRLRGALKPGAYRAVLEPAGSPDGPRLPLAFTLTATEPGLVRLGPP